MNSRAKGARRERELAKWLTERGYPAVRGQQRSGREEQDVVCEALEGFWIECKGTERFKLYEALEQATCDALGREPVPVPTVWHRRNGKDWVVVLHAEDFLALAAHWEAR